MEIFDDDSDDEFGANDSRSDYEASKISIKEEIIENNQALAASQKSSS